MLINSNLFLLNNFNHFKLSSLNLTSFISLVDKTLNTIYDTIDQKDYSIVDSMSLEDGVLTISLNNSKTYVINIQKQNKQIWFSSPFSGPARFEYHKPTNTWKDIQNSKRTLFDIISKEINKELIKNNIIDNSLKLI